MTDKEIKEIATEIANALYNEDRTYNHHLWWSVEPKERKAEEVEDIINVILRDYCIVPKELIRKEYDKAQKTHDIYTSATCINDMESRAIDHAEGRMCELNTLFGSQLFEEEK